MSSKQHQTIGNFHNACLKRSSNIWQNIKTYAQDPLDRNSYMPLLNGIHRDADNKSGSDTTDVGMKQQIEFLLVLPNFFDH